MWKFSINCLGQNIRLKRLPDLSFVKEKNLKTTYIIRLDGFSFRSRTNFSVDNYFHIKERGRTIKIIFTSNRKLICRRLQKGNNINMVIF